MTNYSNNIFKYNNKKYTFFANCYTGKGGDDDLKISMDAADIEEFVYENKLNSLVMTGHLIYTDKYARVDKFLNLHFAYCYVFFAENNQKNDNGLVVEKIDKEQCFLHTFIISGIKVISRQSSVIKYQIDLVSNNWYKCIANVHFSNYNLNKLLIFEILKACFKNNDLTIDDKTFDLVKSRVNLHYITNTNDNLFTISKYLMQKMYYYDLKDSSLKFFLYNESSNKYLLFDVTNRETATGMYSTLLSFFKTNNEGLILQEPTNIGYMKNPMLKPSVYKNFFNYNMYDFSYDLNEFSNKKINTDTTINYANSKFDTDLYEKKFYKLFNSTLRYENEGSYWNNNLLIYDDTVKTFEENNTFVLNITGELLRKPGSLLTVTVDRSMKNITSENKKELEEMKKKYKAYEGIWMVSKVLHIVAPAALKYRLQIIIFRNFIPKLDSTSNS